MGKQHIDVAGVRIIPSVIEFFDVHINRAYKIQVTVKNVSAASKSIRYYSPQSKKFHLKVSNPEDPVAAGLEVPAVLEYKTSELTEIIDRIVVTVDGEVIEVPVKGHPAQPRLELYGPANFGNVVLSAKTIGREITLRNHGSKPGTFKIIYHGQKPITIVPNSGTLLPKVDVKIKVEYVTDAPGVFEEAARVELQGQGPSTLIIKGNVVERKLELLDSTGRQTECLRFGATYYGTDKTELLSLYNNSPEPVNFVCILDEDSVGQELGVDLTMSTAATLAQALKPKNPGQLNTMTSLVSVIPNAGILNPYERTVVCFRFSPRWTSSKQGFDCSVEAPPRQDFAVFMRFHVVCSKTSLSGKNGDAKHDHPIGDVHAEIAITATALPVLLGIPRMAKVDFGECPVGEHVDALYTLRNESSVLPVIFQFRRIAHFRAYPPNGKIESGQSQDVIFTFAPNQIGNFKVPQYVDISGQVADERDPVVSRLEVIDSHPIVFLARCDPQATKMKPKLYPGITPNIANEVGLNAELTFEEAEVLNPKAAMPGTRKMKLHRLTRSAPHDRDAYEADSLVAFPNDRATSIKPTERHRKFKTIFTKSERYNFVDPDYTYTDEEMAKIKEHKQLYSEFVDGLRAKRHMKAGTREHLLFDDDTNIGLTVAGGIQPPKLTTADIVPDPKPPTPPNVSWNLMSTKDLAQLESETSKKTVSLGLRAIPTTDIEKRECSLLLSPHELHKIVIGPPIIDFGAVGQRSVNTQHINIVNNLETHVYIKVEIDCRELRQTSPLQQVVPPMSKAAVPVIFESAARGQFQRSIDYIINGFYKNHVTVMALVIPPSLELSTDFLEVHPTPGLPADAGLRSVISLKNPLNCPAEFMWHPIVGDMGTAFSIRPATGVVDPVSDLECEVVFHPSYLAPDSGSFTVNVQGGAPLKLQCRAEFGATNVQFIERRIMFGAIPLNMATKRKALLFNSSTNHAYFQVLNPNPFPGLTIAPVHGVVPTGGKAELSIELMPLSVIKFDTRIQVAIRNWKTLELRLGGMVEPPCVDIDVAHFNFGGVACGSVCTQEFKLVNKTVTKTRTEFNLTQQADFVLDFPVSRAPDDLSFEAENPGLYAVTLEPSETLTGILKFKPTEVAAYDFILPVSINSSGAPSPTVTPIPPTPAPSNHNTIQHIINPMPMLVTVSTPRKRVIATALRQPVELTQKKVQFELPSNYFDTAQSTSAAQLKLIQITNRSDRILTWAVDLRSPSQPIEDGVFRFVRENGTPFLTVDGGGVNGKLNPRETFNLGVFFCPGAPGTFRGAVPFVLDDDFSHPYTTLEVVGLLKSPHITFEPIGVVMVPVPLLTTATATVQLVASNYLGNGQITLELPQVECEDGSSIIPIVVRDNDGREVRSMKYSPSADGKPIRVSFTLEFQSDRPVSFTKSILFLDALGNSFQLPVSCTADNCLLTCYPFLAQHRLDHQIACEEGKRLRSARVSSGGSGSQGEPMLMPITTPSVKLSRPSTSITPSQFEIGTSSYESDSSSDGKSSSGTRTGAINKADDPNTGNRNAESDDATARKSLGSSLFPDEGLFHTEVLYAMQRWYTAYGWLGGPYPISIPFTLRSGISKLASDEVKTTSGMVDSNTLRKDLRTVYEMIVHLSGRHIPGIPTNGPLPRDRTERVKQVYWQHATMLTFIRGQGGCMASLRPEYLMDADDYRHWKWIQDVVLQEGDLRTAKKETLSEEDTKLSDAIFEAVSKRAWTDLLLQLWKVLVLSRVTHRQLKSMPFPDKDVAIPRVNTDPLCSNVYSQGERIVLAWLNAMYEQYRNRIWVECAKGGVPSARWVVNFDLDLLDGLVIGAALGAYCPFLVHTHLKDMYTNPATAEQCLHNALKVVSAMRYVGIDYDIQAIDITDPNPVAMLLFCVYIYQRLPQYLSKSTVMFKGTLHAPVVRQIRLSNPSSNKPLVYSAAMAGNDARDFSVQADVSSIVIPPKGTLNLGVEFKSRFIRPAEATLILAGHRVGSSTGTTLAFRLVSQVDNITPALTAKAEAPCYELHKITMNVTNPFIESGDFRVVLVEAPEDGHAIGTAQVLLGPKKHKVKKIRSKVNHGQNRAETPPTPEPTVAEPTHMEEKSKRVKDESDASSGRMSAFFCPCRVVHLKGGETRVMQVHFLPFNMGKYTCSIIFANEDIGEFLHNVEAVAVAPYASPLPFVSGSNTARISSAAAASRGRGLFGGNDDIIYWKCDTGQTLNESLTVPVTNVKREEALVTAAQQQMSEMEYERRRVTGTLHSSTITTRAINMLTTAGTQKLNKQPVAKGLRGTEFKVTIDSPYFSAPDKLRMPHPLSTKTQMSGKRSQTGMMVEDGSVLLPITFTSKQPGHFPCKITLKASDDIRVYVVECTVNPPGAVAELEFSAPVHQSVVQNIPVINPSNDDWLLEVRIEGPAFYGPPSLVAKACQATDYPLMFRPSYEGVVKGRLVLENKADVNELVFDLQGIARKPLPLEKLQIIGEVNKAWSRVVDVPNMVKKKLVYRVETDLSFVGGKPAITVLMGQKGKYEIKALPRRRGHYKGVISFVAGKNPITEYDSDGDEIPGSDTEDDEYSGYRVWYTVDADIKPADPVQTLTIRCNCQKRAVVEVPVSNPADQAVTFEVVSNGVGLSGFVELTLGSFENGTYELTYFPQHIGETRGSVIFYNELVGEFWYDLHLVAENPDVTTMAPMECELGRWTQQLITLINPTDEVLELIPTISNNNNFSLERDTERPIVIRPRTQIQVPLNFMPSTLGRGDHTSKIVFHSAELGEWVFTASGFGLLPQPQEPMNLTCAAGSNTTIILPFRNPLDHAVIVDILLTDKDVQYQRIFYPDDLSKDSPFCLLLKQTLGVRLGPKSRMDILISFAPEEMRLYEALCTVVVKKENGGTWQYKATKDIEMLVPNAVRGQLDEIRWLFPLHGTPEVTDKASKPATIRCQTRDRVEERVEVTLSGVASSTAGPSRVVRARAVTPKGVLPDVPEGIVITEAIMVAKEFSHSLEYPDTDSEQELRGAVTLSLVRHQRDPVSGCVDVIFNVAFSPMKQMRHTVQLLVKAATGGVWKFPITFASTEPVPDDVIEIESVGLNAVSAVGFRLTSQDKRPAEFKAYFLAGSAPEFSVSPSSGELLPLDSAGTLVTVSFKPSKYGKNMRAKLVVQTSTMQWTYEVRGTLPAYHPPQALPSALTSAAQTSSLHAVKQGKQERKNYILENLKISTTAASSPLKGAPLLGHRNSS